MVWGGGVINWSFLQNGLVDEVSSIIAPVANGDSGAHRFFTAREPYSSMHSTPSTMSPIPATITLVSGSPNRMWDASAVNATPAAAQMPYATPSARPARRT